jgi:hypothetical protein
MIDGTHTNLYVVTHMFHFVASTTAPYLSVFGSGNYDRKKKVLVVCLAGCAVVSVFGSGGK